MLLKVRVRAGAKNDSVKRLKTDQFAVTTREEAAENRANMRVMQLMAAHLAVPVKKMRIVKGHHTPSKIIEIFE